jgi:hypothetical protein
LYPSDFCHLRDFEIGKTGLYSQGIEDIHGFSCVRK